MDILLLYVFAQAHRKIFRYLAKIFEKKQFFSFIFIKYISQNQIKRQFSVMKLISQKVSSINDNSRVFIERHRLFSPLVTLRPKSEPNKMHEILLYTSEVWHIETSVF